MIFKILILIKLKNKKNLKLHKWKNKNIQTSQIFFIFTVNLQK